MINSSMYFTILVSLSIVLGFLIFGFVEVFFTKDYKKSFKNEFKAINFLESQYREIQGFENRTKYHEITATSVDNELLSWLSHYVDSYIEDGTLKIRIEQGKFAFLCWPSKLNYPVPQSPGHFVPTLLTTPILE